MEETVDLKLRHTSGDAGPFSFPLSHTILQVKEAMYSQWPSEGALSTEHPTSAQDLRLLYAGKFLDNAKSLRDYHKEMGDPEPGGCVVMHILVRPAAAGKAAASKADAPAKGGAAAATSSSSTASSSGCCGGCTIS